MWLLLAAILAFCGWFLFRRLRRTAPVDDRLTLRFWRNSVVVTGLYLLFILLGAGLTRIMVGFNNSNFADVAMVGFFILWVLYGAVWLLRFLPSTRPKPGWLTRSRVWLDTAALLTLAALAAGARMV
ncbi:MAG TPA: hypothetical protein VIL88_09680 [Devosia sp.]|jgi:glucan phosphoethanolaminetransferase (alkaline phosphatase superfamily)|uniref:hypothetical protein n=1 Tax=Devosia sp. TaxID=1871048 RepID=UPI002F94A449